MNPTPSKEWGLFLVVLEDDDGYQEVEAQHVIPLDDLIVHEYSEDCVCGPSSELLDDGTWQYSHESLDRREDA